MRIQKRSFWISLALINLCIVAALGFSLRSKILFSLPAIDYRNFLSAHSHFAFAGWVGLALTTLLIYNILPEALAKKKIYQWILWGIEISSLGMAAGFPFWGYNAFTLFFSTLYIVVTMIFAPVFITDALKCCTDKTVRLLSIASICSLVLSFLGTLGLAYILISKTGNSILYRDSIYTFLHFQYNGFFTLAVIALLFQFILNRGFELEKKARLFANYLVFSIIPALPLSLLWHNKTYLYVFAGIGCILILISLFYFSGFIQDLQKMHPFTKKPARTLWLLAGFSFGLKMLLNVGTVFPQLGNAVYGDRPVIIGFLHLVFLGFVTFFVLSMLIEQGYFTRHNRVVTYPFVVFGAGVLLNELLLALQGLGILFKTNSFVYNWLLWGAAIVLFLGALLIALNRFSISRHSDAQAAQI